MITSILKRMQPNRPHLAILVVLLVCTLVLTGFLAYQGYDAGRSQRLQAEDRLRDWAKQAAHKLDERLQTALVQFLYYEMVRTLRDHQNSMDVETFARTFDIRRICPCLSDEDLRTAFTYDFGTGNLDTQGHELSPVVRNWMVEGLHNQKGARIGAYAVGTLRGTPDGMKRVVFYAVVADAQGQSARAYGVDTGSRALEKIVNQTWRAEPISVNPSGAPKPADWVLSAIIADGRGEVWYRSAGRYPQLYTGTRPVLEGVLSGLTITVAVRPDAADDLFIGGLPSTRLLTLFILLGLTAGLLVVALVLIRREAEITRLRSDFIAGVSHELRTPLAQIRMFAETLMLGRVRSEVEHHRSLEIIDQEARRLTHLVENVLLFARSERRSGRINPERIDIAADIRDAIHGFAILCRSKAIEIRPELQEGVTAPVDRGALRQILLNLLDNAAKYGPLAQRITVGMALFDRAVRIWVDDEGPGIPEADRIRVFESFYRLDRDIASPVAGSGIGLAIVRELVQLHDGRGWIDDAPGGGARVVVEFPAAYLRPEVAKDEWAVA